MNFFLSDAFHGPTRRRVTKRLMLEGTWVPREQLEKLTTCPPALDDALSDLVIEGKAEFRPGSGYRIAGTPLERRALRSLFLERRTKPTHHSFLDTEASGDTYEVAVARVLPDLGVVTYSLTVPASVAKGQDLNDHIAFIFNLAESFQALPCQTGATADAT